MHFSLFFFLIFVPLVLLPILGLRRKPAYIPLVGIVPTTSPWRGRIVRITLFCAASFLAMGIVAPPIPITKTVVVRSQTECARDILAIFDVSGSTKDVFKSARGEEEASDKFDIALSSLHAFAAGRADDCFGTVIFSGPGQNFAGASAKYAFLLNDGVRDPDQLILALKEGLSGPAGTKALHQFAFGTRISEGILVAEEFFAGTATSDAHVAILISDLGNEADDNAKTMAAISRLLAGNVRFYIFGVDVSEGSSFPGTLRSFARENNIPFRDIDREQDFTKAYRFVDALEPAPAPIYETHTATLNVPNRWFFGAALMLTVPWMFLRFTKRRIP